MYTKKAGAHTEHCTQHPVVLMFMTRSSLSALDGSLYSATAAAHVHHLVHSLLLTTAAAAMPASSTQ